ncbi:MAG: PD40 domain-containing protein [Anaerolineales bacterium]|nr:PD40 domain-containing protein [Anaerolineales bacterium]
MRAFSEADADNFFGRETLVQQLLARLGEGGDLSRFLAVIGPSGSGKSSVVRAGLIPALRRGGLPGSENWFIVDMLPGKHPFEELEASLLRVAVNPPEHLLSQMKDGNRGLLRAVHRILPADASVELVLVIDQFEEVFTLIEDEAERALLLENLASAVLDERSRLRVVITLRADFTDKPLRYVDFGELMNRRFEFILPLTADELERAILAPAQRVGLKLEKGLVSTIIREVGNQPGALPLLQYALSELFDKRDGRTLTNKAYQEIGGVLGALGRSAETIYFNMDEAAQTATCQLFLRLVTLGEGTEDTRRRVLRDEIESLHEDHQSALQKVIDIFGKARLLSFDRDPITRNPTIEVAHEALLREWTRLREWLNESRADVRTQRQLNHAVQEWNHAQRDASFLMAGSRLEQFEGWSSNTTIALTQDERAFLSASIAERDRRELEEQARQGRELQAAQKLAETENRAANQLRRRAVFLAGALALAVVAAIFAGVFANRNGALAVQNESIASTAQAAEALAVKERNTAEQQALIASVRELSSEANINLDIDPELSILLALQAVNKTYTIGQPVLPEAEDALHRAVQTSRLELTLSGHTDIVWKAVFSPDGKLIASGSQDGTAKIWDAITGKELFTIKATTEGDAGNVDFSPNGKLLATGGGDKIARLWDVSTGKELLALKGHLNEIYHVAFSPDGNRLATASNDGTVKIWDIVAGEEILTLSEEAGTTVYWVAFSPDGLKVVTANENFPDGWGTVWSLDTGQKLFTLSGSYNIARSASFSPNGAYIVTSGDNQMADIWNAQNGAKLLTLYGHGDAVTSAAFSPDSTRLATSSYEGHTKIWDVATGQQLFDIAGGRDLNTVAFSPDGTRIVTSSWDHTVKVWNVAPSREVLTLDNGSTITSKEGGALAYSPDGTRLATANSDLTPRIWDLKTGKLLFQLVGHTDAVTLITYSADGTRIATASHDGTARIWDAFTGKELLTLSGHKDFVQGVNFNLDGTRIATSSFDKTVKIWDANTGKNLLTLKHPDWVFSVAFSPDGARLVASIFNSHTAKVWDVSTGRELLNLDDHTDVIGQVVFSPDGTRVVTASTDGTAKIWDAKTGNELFSLSSHSAGVSDVAYSKDGRFLATASYDKTAKIWDALTGRELLTLYAPNALTGVAFDPDGTKLAVASRDGTYRIYLLRIEDLIALAKSRVTRQLTLEECQQYLHLEACPAAP